MSDENADKVKELRKPNFNGCIFCYTGEWVAYVVKKLKK